MAIPQSFIHELLTRVDVVEIVGRYVQLKKGGANFMGLCPFHGEKSPSFSVSPTKQFYHCFGCGKNGDAINFLMEQTGMSFREAVEDLAQQHGLQIPEDDASPEDRARAAEHRQKQATLTDVLEKAGEAWRKQLKNSPRAVDYLKRRGLSGEIAKRFGLGYAPEGWRGLASVFPDYTDPLLAESGLVIVSQEEGEDEKRYDRFRDRVMFPIRNVKGECIGFGGRVLGDEKPKYLNSPETPVFSKGRELYGLFEARDALRDAGYVLVTEGYMDVVALAQLGFPNAVATLGTACTTEHAQKLFRFTDSVVFSFDGDSAGRRAARRALDAAPAPRLGYALGQVFVLAGRARPRQLHPRVRRRSLLASRHRGDAAQPLPDRRRARGTRPVLRRGPRPHGRQCQAPVAGAARRRTEAPAAGRDRHAGAAGHAGARRPVERPAPRWRSQRGRERPARRRDGASREGGSRSYSRQGGRKPWEREPPRMAGRRVPPSSRADHAARLLLGHMHAWEQLSNEDHLMLCGLPAPHGPLFAWLDSQIHEHGPMTWTHLKEALAGQPFEELALRVASGPDGLTGAAAGAAEPAAPAASAQEWADELRDLLNRMLVERLKALETQAIEDARSDPAALDRYRALQARRRELESAT